MEENKKYVWSIFTRERDKEVFLGGAICIDPSGHLLTTVFGTKTNMARFKVRSPANNNYDVHRINDWTEFGLLLLRVVGEDEEVFEFVSVDDVNKIDVDEKAFSFVHQDGLSNGFLQGLCSYASPPNYVELAVNENSYWKLTEQIKEYNSLAVKTNPIYRTIQNTLDSETIEALPLLSKLHLELPLLQFSGFGKRTQDTYNGSSGCPVFKADNMKLIGLIMFFKNSACLVVPLSIIQQAREVLSGKRTLKNKNEVEEKRKGGKWDDGKDHGGGKARKRGRKRRGSRGGCMGGSSGASSSGFLSSHLHDIVGVGFGRSAKVDPFLTRIACIALRRLSEEDRKMLLASNGTCIFSALESLVACLWRLDKIWSSAADEALVASHALHPALALPEMHWLSKVSALWDLFCFSIPKTTVEQCCGALSVLCMAAKSSSGFLSSHLQDIIGVGFGRPAKVDPFLTRIACIALQRLSEEYRKKLLASNGTCILSALESLVAGLWLLDKIWNSAADKAVGAFYALRPAPESNAARTVMKSRNSVFHPGEFGDLEHEMEDGTGRGQTTVQVGKLGRYLFFISHVAMHQLVYHESCVRKIQKQKAKKNRQDGSINTELGVAASEDARLNALADRAEREILSGASHDKNLLGYCVPSLSKICRNLNFMQKNPDLQAAAASLALCLFMNVNAAYCEANLELLFSGCNRCGQLFYILKGNHGYIDGVKKVNYAGFPDYRGRSLHYAQGV